MKLEFSGVLLIKKSRRARQMILVSCSVADEDLLGKETGTEIKVEMSMVLWVGNSRLLGLGIR